MVTDDASSGSAANHAILRYKLWDIGIVVRDTAALSLTVLVGVLALVAQDPPQPVPRDTLPAEHLADNDGHQTTEHVPPQP